MTTVDKGAETLELPYSTDGNRNGAAALQNTLEVPQKVEYRVMIQHLGMYPGDTKYRFIQKLMYGYSKQHYLCQPQSGNSPKVHYLKNELKKKKVCSGTADWDHQPGLIRTACLSWLAVGGPHEELSATWNTNQENSGGAKRGHSSPQYVYFF